ncbi:4-(cytidine 5'-diphospho)-2-C-methyl-D-erythritol kinase [Azohydromonas caseinilytica]|uniref:4-diphosphocytidyl-2-C-methyl-D-erythritol kinase n=1 Tax=Azohydromonas caseinilytica TaxID=2728836 RepID=A0A848F2Y7_9BURK|nr:4-(cytidine 5'-diphospho)-2-C-methyl-D-erythritol kinase [Azohydromonas caseinilytica]NML13398.1 4-(cytidine 5'-diphospho)-2-C-methyl-D-erythritol kinase [Azohydromonas caseinilytica]
MPLRALYDVPAPAKLNLFLHVVGRREDGYHLLQSVFVLVDWCDTLHFELRQDGQLYRHDLGPALPEVDLALRAARLLQQRSGTSLGADISVLKRVPWGAGMGGGSSDAASVLLALNRLWSLGWSRAQLLELAPQLGADVPFFVGGCNAFVEGIGERLTPVQVPKQRFAVIRPPVELPTKDIFSSPLLAGAKTGATVALFPADDASQTILQPGFGRNDLQAAAEDRAPEVAQAARWLRNRYGNSRMTGSGSAVFARIEKCDTIAVSAEAISSKNDASALASLPSGWLGKLCHSLDRHPLESWAG